MTTLRRPFAPADNTLMLTAGTTSTSVQIPARAAISTQVVITNNGTATAFVAFGSATVAAVIPIVGTPANGIAILANTSQSFSINSGTYVAAITASGTASLYITPGFGF